MKVILKYQRLPKPRGSWWYGIKWSFLVQYSEDERAKLNPSWSFRFDEETVKCSTRCKGDFYPMNISLTVQPNTGLPDHRFPQGTEWYFKSAEDRAAFIVSLHKMRDAAVQAHLTWWNANPPDEGEADETVSLVLCEGDSITRLEGDSARMADRMV